MTDSTRAEGLVASLREAHAAYVSAMAASPRDHLSVAAMAAQTHWQALIKRHGAELLSVITRLEEALAEAKFAPLGSQIAAHLKDQSHE